MEQEKNFEESSEKVICEIWKPIKGYEGIYEISNLGNIKRNNLIRKIKPWSKYKVVGLCKNGISKTFYVHRLVAEAFIPNPDNKPMINHIDGNKLNNCVENLEWCTKQENEIHAWNHGMKEKVRKTSKENIKIARRYINNKISVAQMDLDGNIIRIWESASDVMKDIGIDGSSIIKCCRGKLKKTGGYKWKYIE